MPAIIPFIPAIGAGIGALFGGLSNSAGARTTTTSGTTSSNQSATTTRNLTDGQQQIQAPLYDYATRLLADPGAAIAPIRQAGYAQINKAYAGAVPALATKLLAYGGGKSGKFGTAARQSELARVGSLGSFEGGLAQDTLQQQNYGAGLASQLLNMNFGSTVNSTSSGTTSGTSVAPGSTAAGALGGGISTLLSLLKLMQGGGGGGGGGGGSSAPFGTYSTED